MPRPEQPVDPSRGPVERFAADLRALRDGAGNPPYRTMATRVHFSKASLSAAAAGHRLPTWDVTRAYVSACAGDPEQWHERWLQARAAVGLPATADAVDPSTEPSPVPATRFSRRFLAQVVVAGLATSFAVIGVGAWMGRDRPDGASVETGTDVPARPAGASQPVEDGSDPKKSGCAFDVGVSTLDKVEIVTPQNNFLGTAELRYSPKCRVAWGRFTPGERLGYLKSPASITITARRPATRTTGEAFTAAYDGQAVFGDILSTHQGCVEATVVVVGADGGGTATTACRP